MNHDLAHALGPYRRHARWAALLVGAGSAMGGLGVAVMLSATWTGVAGAPSWSHAVVTGVLLLSALGAVALGAWHWAVRARAPGLLAAWSERMLPGTGDAVRGAVGLAEASSLDGASAALARAYVHHAALQLQKPEHVSRHRRGSVREARVHLAVAALGVVLAAGGYAWQPGRVRTGLALATGLQRVAPVRPAALPPLWTDVTAELVFPAYMKRTPQVLEGITGDFTAPKGTEVTLRARADRAVASARLILPGSDLVLQVAPPRSLSGRFVVAEPGRYRVALTEPDGDEAIEQEGHLITVESDDVPGVELREPASDDTVQPDSRVPVLFTARDDHGLTEFNLVVRNLRSGGDAVKVPLARPKPDAREHQGRGVLDVAVLRARPGDRLSLSVEARDNDTVSGPKAGMSATRTLKVFSAAEHHEELIARQEEVMRRMVVQLADEMETPLNVPKEAGDARAVAEAERWAAQTGRGQAITEELQKISAAFLKDELAPMEVVRAFKNIRADLARVYDELVVLAGEMGNQVRDNGRFPDPYVQRSRRLGTQAAGRLETHILYMDDLVQKQRLSLAEDAAKELAETQQRLRDLLKKYKEAGDEATRTQIMQEMDALRRQLRDLAERLARLRREMPQEYINPDALKNDDIAEPMADIDRMLAEGDLEGAMAALEKMAQGTQKLLEDMKKGQDELGGEDYAELREKLQEFKENLEEVTAAQEELLQQSKGILERAREKARKEAGGNPQRQMAELQQQAEALLKDLKDVPERGMLDVEQNQREEAEARAEEVARALKAEDADQAVQSVEQMMSALQWMRSSLADRTDGPFGVNNRDTRSAREQMDGLMPRAKALADALSKLAPDPQKFLGEGERSVLRDNARKQGKLAERVRQLTQDMDNVGREAPVFSPEHREALDGARRDMQGAQADLGSQDVPGARGRQQSALGRMQELKKNLQQMAQQGSGSGGGIPSPFAQGGEGGPREGQGRNSQERVEIPDAEQFKVPAQFRQDILDAMKEGAPRSFEQEVKQYYEELVK